MTDEGKSTIRWFVLVYKLPSEPSRYRASVWRKLKTAGAVYLQNGVAALPDDPSGERTMRGIGKEVQEFGGTAHLFKSDLIGNGDNLRRAFDEARDAEYTEVLEGCQNFQGELRREREAGNLTFAELEENEQDLARLESWANKIRERDRFGAPLFERVEREMSGCRESLQAFAESVYRAADHGSASP